MLKKLLAATAALALSATPAAAQRCAPTVEMLNFLTGEKYGEKGVYAFETQDGPGMILINEDTGTFSVVGFPSSQNGAIACLVFAGEALEPVRPADTEPGEDS